MLHHKIEHIHNKTSKLNTVNKLNEETYQFIKKHNVRVKICINEQKQSFITLKSYKTDFSKKN